jgi:hypothetical protein
VHHGPADDVVLDMEHVGNSGLEHGSPPGRGYSTRH